MAEELLTLSEVQAETVDSVTRKPRLRSQSLNFLQVKKAELNTQSKCFRSWSYYDRAKRKVFFFLRFLCISFNFNWHLCVSAISGINCTLGFKEPRECELHIYKSMYQYSSTILMTQLKCVQCTCILHFSFAYDLLLGKQKEISNSIKLVRG